MDKFKLLQVIEEHLREELVDALREPGSERAAELQKLLTVYRFLPRRTYGAEDPVIPSALVELELGATRAFYFVAPSGGGLITQVDGKPVQVITPQSPLGEALLGKKVGEPVQVEIRGTRREYRVISIG